jgi:hypothetical protein
MDTRLPSIITNKDPGQVKGHEIKRDEKYYINHPSVTHSSEELAAVHRAVRFTQTFLQDESNKRYLEEEFIERPLPSTMGKILKRL